MSTGIDVFKEHFADFKEQYVVIGDTACELLLSEEALDFRQTKDIDMVLIVEALTNEFAEAFGISLKKAVMNLGPGRMASLNFTDF